MLAHPRPVGHEPVIYLTKPDFGPPELVEVGPGHFEENPFSPNIEEFGSEIEARRFYKKYYPSQYQDLKVLP